MSLVRCEVSAPTFTGRPGSNLWLVLLGQTCLSACLVAWRKHISRFLSRISVSHAADRSSSANWESKTIAFKGEPPTVALSMTQLRVTMSMESKAIPLSLAYPEPQSTRPGRSRAAALGLLITPNDRSKSTEATDDGGAPPYILPLPPR